MSDEPPQASDASPPLPVWNEFLEREPPEPAERLARYALESFATPSADGSHYMVALQAPSLRLQCDSNSCLGDRIFAGTASGGHYFRLPFDNTTPLNHALLQYRCRNCDTSTKLFSVLYAPTRFPGQDARVVKLGEWPPFGERMTRDALKLITPDTTLFLKGRSCENRGLGIGALTYYRRVLDNQRVRVVDALLRAATAAGAGQETIDELKWAREAWRFENSVDNFKAALPDSLRIAGQNPLLLLHSALSKGVHDLSDEGCLKGARAARTVLVELGDRIKRVMEQRDELHGAVKELRLRREAAELAKKKDSAGPE